MYTRPILKIILDRLNEPKIQILLGARQVGKTTLILQALNKVDLPSHYAIAENGYNASWIEQQWSIATMKSNGKSSILVIDEIQKIPNWSERVKRLYDENIINSQKIHLVVLGSSSLSLQKGLTESMAGRFEVIYIPHWSLSECEEAFGMSLDEYIFYGGYPGSIAYKSDEERFFSYIQESIIEPVVSRDILSQNIINKPSLLRELFRLGSEYSGQILSFNKMLGQLQDAGNTTTLSHYLTLLDQSFVLRGIYKYSNKSVLRRQSSPKLQIYNMALQTASYRIPFENIMSNPEMKGRFVESCVGAYLLSNRNAEVFYWRDDNKEVDFIVRYKGKIIAIEVKSGIKYKPASGLESFSNSYQTDRKILVGSGGVPLELFLKNPIDAFI